MLCYVFFILIWRVIVLYKNIQSNQTLQNKKRVIDLFHLPPCRSSLKLHARTSNFTAKFRQADQKIMVYERAQQHVWNEDFSLEWVDEILPTDIAKQLDARDIECDYDTDSEFRMFRM